LRSAIAYPKTVSFLALLSKQYSLRRPLAEQLEVEYSAKLAQIHSEILNFPQQYKTIVGERGITLSGGQRQRTALGRAMLVRRASADFG